MLERATRLVQDVAADRDRQALDPALAPADRERIEQGLGRVLVAPSPALITAQSTCRASSATAPLSGWRTTSTSGCMAFSVIAVSISVSPFLMDELATDMLTTSAPSRLPASSKLVWVRVELSKNRLIWVRPLQQLQLLVGLPVQPDEAVGPVEQIRDLERLQALDAEQVLAPKTRGCGVRGHRARTMPPTCVDGKGSTLAVRSHGTSKQH